MTSIGDAVLRRAQESIRLQINQRAKSEGWGIVFALGGGFAVKWVGKDKWRNDQADLLIANVWLLGLKNTDSVEAEAVEWLRINCIGQWIYARAQAEIHYPDETKKINPTTMDNRESSWPP